MSRTGRVRLSEERIHLQHPSVDVTMRAAADTFGGRTIGVLLTGMGRDGAEGMLAIKQAGGITLAQDETSSTIFGMPRAAKEVGAVEELLPPGDIAKRLIALVQERSRSVTA
jgi:two-component system chemotaxis response regulator CheB